MDIISCKLHQLIYLLKLYVQCYIKPSSKQDGELCSLSRKQPKNALLTGHCHLKGHLFKPGLVDDLKCNRRKQASERAAHVLRVCDCDTVAVLV